jgi:hypothetical protein
LVILQGRFLLKLKTKTMERTLIKDLKQKIGQEAVIFGVPDSD